MDGDVREGLDLKTLFGVAGKTVLITGGSRGIGEMIARGFVENKARVYISSRNAQECHATARLLAGVGSCVSLPCDLSSNVGIGKLVSMFVEQETGLDVLINNAGATWGAPLDDFPESGWDKTMDLNLKSIFFLTQKMLPQLRIAAGSGPAARVINIASIDGLRPPEMETYAYSASKAGCLMLTRHLAKRLVGENILVNAIAPGPFRTKMTAAFLQDDDSEWIRGNPQGRAGRASDIAGTAIYLASAASAYMTGAVIPCDGGWATVT